MPGAFVDIHTVPELIYASWLGRSTALDTQTSIKCLWQYCKNILNFFGTPTSTHLPFSCSKSSQTKGIMKRRSILSKSLSVPCRQSLFQPPFLTCNADRNRRVVGTCEEPTIIERASALLLHCQHFQPPKPLASMLTPHTKHPSCHSLPIALTPPSTTGFLHAAHLALYLPL